MLSKRLKVILESPMSASECVQRGESERREIQSPGEEISESVKDEARRLLRQIVSPPYPGESVKSLINRAARKAGLTAGRCKKYWYGEVGLPTAEEIDALRRAAAVGNRGKEQANGSGTVDREYLRKIEERMDELHRKIDELLSRDPLGSFDVATADAPKDRKASAQKSIRAG